MVPEDLQLEITESSLVDDDPGTLSRLTRLRQVGIRLAIDDFGTGYASMGYLTRLPVDVIKIDRSFISELPCTRETASVVASMIALAQELNLRVHAEGIETSAQLENLRDRRCQLGQGYYFARPMNGEAATQLLQEARSRSLPA